MVNKSYPRSNNFLKDYVKVDDLIVEMNKKYPEGRLVTEALEIGEDFVVFKTSFYENADTDIVKCTGHARQSKIDHAHWFEKCEQKSRGRCLRVLLGKGVTAEEMEDVSVSDIEDSSNIKSSENPVIALNSAYIALQEIQKTVTGGALLKLINDSLVECELPTVTTLQDAANKIEQLGESDAAELTVQLNENSVKILS